MSDWSSCSAVERDLQKVSGAWVFKGSRVPVRALFENLEDGRAVDAFLEWFPGVSKGQVQGVLETSGYFSGASKMDKLKSTSSAGQ